MFSTEILVLDGAMGTELYERGYFINRPFEELNLRAPAEVLAVHRSYLDVGAKIICTNSFSIARPQLKKFDIENKQEELLTAALQIANEAVKGTDAKIALSLGPTGELVEPLGPTGKSDIEAEFEHLARLSKKSSYAFDLYHLETFTNLSELESAVIGIRNADKQTPILISVSSKPGAPQFLNDFARLINSRDDVQAAGLNCSEGPSEVLSQLQILRPLVTKPIWVKPNAGIPRQINGRYFYMTSPDYLAKYARRFVEAGAQGVGGCCGTGPIHIKAIAGAVHMMQSKQTVGVQEARIHVLESSGSDRPPLSERKESKIGNILASGKKFISIEITSPKGTDLKDFWKHLENIEKAGVHFVNVPDGARASTRVSSLHLAAAVAHRKFKNLSVLPHFTTRDRNLIALQSDLLGASINGVHDVLLVTGDPPKLGNNKEATAVFDIDAIGLTHLVDCLNRGISPSGEPMGSRTQFGIGVASNPTASNLETEAARWKFKVQMGADFSITQPIYDPDSFYRWLELIKGFERPHFVGIWPFVSLRNAEFMANEVPGVHVPKWALEEMARAGSDRDEATKRGIAIARKVMEQLAPVVQGFCVSAPLGRVEVALATIE